jgi:SAM-dependent methyltransferase
MSYGKEQAAAYEDQPEHMLLPEEARAWLAEMLAVAGGVPPQGRLLDIGAGTGLLTAVMKAASFRVTGLEPSPAMIAQGLKRSPILRRDDFAQGAADDAGLFEAGRFDWIVSRQTLCHLTEPAACFAIWRRWLGPGGHVLLVDGFWAKSSWTDSQREAQPFAALDNALPVAEALAGAGFTVLKSGPFAALDEARAGRFPNTKPRYLVAARKG